MAPFLKTEFQDKQRLLKGWRKKGDEVLSSMYVVGSWDQGLEVMKSFLPKRVNSLWRSLHLDSAAISKLALANPSLEKQSSFHLVTMSGLYFL